MVSAGSARKGIWGGVALCVLGTAVMASHLWLIRSAFSATKTHPPEEKAARLAEAISNAMNLFAFGVGLAVVGCLVMAASWVLRKKALTAEETEEG